MEVNAGCGSVRAGANVGVGVDQVASVGHAYYCPGQARDKRSG